MEIKIPPYAQKIMNCIEKSGEQVYIVGGCVRDALLGVTPNDYDMTLSCTPEITSKILEDCGFTVIKTGLKHGTVTAISDGMPVELTTFRIDGSYSDSRRPNSVSFTRSLAEDLARRDFTVNAMAYGRHEGLVDIFGGRADLQNKLIRAVGEPEKRFSEDALRIMRAFRFSAVLGFKIDEDTLSGSINCREGLKNISRERIGAEFIKLLTSKYPEKSLFVMRDSGILPYAIGTDTFAPSDKIISKLSLMPEDDFGRLGFFLAEADEGTAKAILEFLKCSNRQKSGALSVRRGSAVCVKTAAEAARLRSASGENALCAVSASVLLSNSPPEALELVKSHSLPSCISQLALGGKELMALGLSGKDIGTALSQLLTLVIDGKVENTKEALAEEISRNLDSSQEK